MVRLEFAEDSETAKLCRKGARQWKCTPDEFFTAAFRHEFARREAGEPDSPPFTKEERRAYKKIKAWRARFQKFVDAEKAKRPELIGPLLKVRAAPATAHALNVMAGRTFVSASKLAGLAIAAGLPLIMKEFMPAPLPTTKGKGSRA